MLAGEELKTSFNWRLALAAQSACVLEVDAPKVGNVNRFHDFEDCSLEDFHRSALAIAPAFGCLEKLGVGRTIFEAVKATRKFVSTNTNLGIVFLLAPLGMAWCRMVSRWGLCVGDGFSLRRKSTGYKNCGGGLRKNGLWQEEIGKVLDSLTVRDTGYVYKAIKLASPSGMGQVKEYDVYEDEYPQITLLKAMQLAADRDIIARQYANKFELVLNEGYETMQNCLAEGLPLPLAIAQTHLFLLSRYQDTLIVRKLGVKAGREVQRRASTVWEAGGWFTAAGKDKISELDRWLRQGGHRLNPGSTADLTAAIIFVWLLEKETDMEGEW